MTRLDGKIALITGSTDGVGRVVATRLGAAGAHVLAHGRDRARGECVVADIRAAGGRADSLIADLASLAEVRRLAEIIRQDNDRLDILVNNAGIGTAGAARQTSADGHELRFAVNYLAGFQLTYLLLPLLRAGAPSRIVNVSSAGQQAIDFDDVMLTHGYSGIARMSEQTGTDHVYRRSGAGTGRFGYHGERAAPSDLHEHCHGAAGGRDANEHRRTGRGSDPEPCHRIGWRTV